MISEDELVDFLREQIRTEREIIASLDKALAEIENPAVKGTLKGITLDSMKHAWMYEAAINILTGAPKAITQEQLSKQKRLMEKHILLEADIIRRINEALPRIKDEKVRLLLDAILSDERRHHRLLKEIVEIIIQGETITDEEWFDMLWKNTPFHGAPGG